MLVTDHATLAREAAEEILLLQRRINLLAQVRVQAIQAMREQGCTYAEIGRQLGLSKEYVGLKLRREQAKQYRRVDGD